MSDGQANTDEAPATGDVHPGGGSARDGLGAAALAAGYFFFLLLGYYMLRPVREAMGIRGGVDRLPWLMTATMVAMAAVNPVYAALVSRWPRRRFIPWVYRFAAANLVLFYVLFELTPEHGGIGLGYAFYIWLSVFNLFVVSVFWGFVGDMFGPERAKRLFGIVAVGGTLGAIVGAQVAGLLVGGMKVGPWLTVSVPPPTMMLLAVVPLELAVRCMMALARRFGLMDEAGSMASAGQMASAGRMEPAGKAEPGPGAWEGIRLVAGSRYLQMIGVYILLYAMTSTLLYLEQARIVKATFTDPAAQTAAFAKLDLWTNLLTLGVQLFLTGRIMGWLGVRGTLAIVPALSVVGFAALAVNPTFGVLAVFQVLRRGLHYAVDRPAREVLFTVLSADAKYKSKPLIDTFIYRTGDLIGVWTPGWLALMGVGAAVVAVPAAAVWGVTGIVLGTWQRRAAGGRAPA
jgi:AAA family ATP:ADP antiporter